MKNMNLKGYMNSGLYFKKFWQHQIQNKKAKSCLTFVRKDDFRL